MPARHRIAPAVAAGALVVLAAGCSGGSGSGTAAGTPSPSVTTTPSASAADRLAADAAAGASARYQARYRLVPKGHPAGTLRVFKGAGTVRVDIVEGPDSTVLVVGESGSVGCRLAGGTRTCFTLAGPGKPLPALFDAGVQRVFSSYLATLAADPGGYDVTADGTTPAGTSVPAGRCYRVSPRPTAESPVVPAGRYCLSAQGVVTAASFPSGELTLAALGGPPLPVQLSPPASPTPLPSAS